MPRFSDVPSAPPPNVNRADLVRVVDDGCTSNQGGHWGHRTGISMLRKFWHHPDGTWAILNSSDIPPTPVRDQPNPFAETFARPAAARDHLELSTGSTP